MVALRRFFQAERGLSMDHSERESRASSLLQSDPHSANVSQPLDGQNRFQQIEKQFEIMHDQLQTQPLSPHSHVPPSRGSTRPKERNPGHVDLLDALFSSHRYHIQSTTTLSPITPYNEDIAERNMTRFLQGQPRKKNVYTRFLSALYQEDVAERNMTKSRRRSRSLSRTRDGQSRGQDNAGSHSRSRAGDSRGTELNSREITSPMSMNDADRHASSARERILSGKSSLRHQKSAPNLSAERAGASQGAAGSNPGGHLSVPPAHKQGDTWRNTPLPDSPTIPVAMRQDKNMNENHPIYNRYRGSGYSRPSLHRGPLITPRLGSKKNVRDLSINTELAALGRSAAKISHRAIQPPTPNTLEKQNPSIAEVMNSPLPAGTPTSISPLPTSNQKVAEIMEMFRQAYSTSQAITPHPTFETLQDAIIREINSHEAFNRVPPPERGPPFTPSPSQDTFEPDLDIRRAPGGGRSRSSSLKDGQISKLIRRGSFKNHSRSKSSETRKSKSSSVSPKIFRRRHTDAPPPSPGFLDTFETKKDGREEQVTYMDLLSRSEKLSPNSEPESTLSPPQMPERSKTAPSVLHLRAQTSASSSESWNSLSVDDSDEEVIQLPSVDIPYVQIQGVDENSVSYVTGQTPPQDAYRLMNWPRKSRKSISLKNRPGSNHSQPTPKLEHHVRGMRSVESY
ncbi:hypothetical protein P170DRAFT_509151 [Aspergillus steynii IBT 23096]|uniref:Uncharacterized protein n=1 Tax=Aspergillus steynii IBT 23096 TaxID=1392250 RepID=A0A2I2GE61_9EURO|nr:uncharacterized protein P170DRAFT_509151 [Aspergillus steynii IBT 23096]PLB51117.1 hypothetical protein P170DRAFT_509151 [Aspergillus steynii IBT 23096]